jgi:hypothetical protein
MCNKLGNKRLLRPERHVPLSWWRNALSELRSEIQWEVGDRKK